MHMENFPHYSLWICPEKLQSPWWLSLCLCKAPPKATCGRSHLFHGACGRQKNGPKHVRELLPGSSGCVSSWTRMDFANVTLRMSLVDVILKIKRRLSWMIPGGPMSSSGSSQVKEGVRRVRGTGGLMRKPLLLALKTQEEARSQGMQAPLETGKNKETDSPPELPEGTQPCDTLSLERWDPYLTSDIQNCKIIHVCGLTLPSLWSLVTAARRNWSTAQATPRVCLLVLRSLDSVWWVQLHSVALASSSISSSPNLGLWTPPCNPRNISSSVQGRVQQVFKKFCWLERQSPTANLSGLCFPGRAHCWDRKSSALNKINGNSSSNAHCDEGDEDIITTRWATYMDHAIPITYF